MKLRFSSMVSHEFRTPLAVILSSTGILEMNLERFSPEKVRERLQKIAAQVHRLTRLMDDVLVISKAEAAGMAFNPTKRDLGALCETIIDEITHQDLKADRIIFTHTGQCEDVLVDEDLIRHILLNLLTNAMKYSPVNNPVYLNLNCGEGKATFIVKDEGIGIPFEAQQQLFDAFFRANNVGTIAGTGLGMTIVKRAVEAHRGGIDFHSVQGEGTTFIVTIPIDLAS
jgi:signal transduction histidine kinase